MGRSRKSSKEDVELDITSFMNLMIVLVPVLLMNMVFAHTAILDLKLPAGAVSDPVDDPKNQTIELIVREGHMTLNYPAGILLRQFPKVDGQHDYKALSELLQTLKQTFQNKDIDKKDILLLLEDKTDYQTVVSAMDTVRSFETVLITDVVNAELFPNVSLGDAPGGFVEAAEGEVAK